LARPLGGLGNGTNLCPESEFIVVFCAKVLRFKNVSPQECQPSGNDAIQAQTAELLALGSRSWRRSQRESREKLERRCAWRRYERGEPIVDYLDASGDVFFIASGNLRVTIYSVAGKAVSFNDLGLGEVFGEYPAIDRGLLALQV